ncbi:PREDICTED: endoplasmic reticulum-Golgi intermediate compartment protein 2 [Propithecus coquereli]|uniref:endoplasmic reticulum-Golgi intermediate compartment protein 2 n=1 Tax=Propithecus coquereli TaxID=379532 RepID=UPI00063F4CAD|nr:PREDICTED: endoplasmic reticulum-Golgi intermediate compartment protein 2 [Propithecus coquereli]
MRRLNRKKTLSLVKELDAFPKVPDSYVETSASGGTDVGADVLDLAETMVASADGLVYEPFLYDVSSVVCGVFRMLQLIQSRLQEEHSLQDVIFKSAFKISSTALPPREDDPLESPDACRIRGHLYVNKVAGNFHITVGKYVLFFCCCWIDEKTCFAFILDNQMFQYFITVVPTKLHTYKISADTHQFSVTERERIINHAAGSHGVSGIFMKYDLSSLMVTVTEEHMPFWQFFVRLCGIVGGIFSTTGMLHGIGKFIVEIICCRFRLGSYKPVNSVPFEDGHTDNHLPLLENNTH